MRAGLRLRISAFGNLAFSASITFFGISSFFSSLLSFLSSARAEPAATSRPEAARSYDIRLRAGGAGLVVRIRYADGTVEESRAAVP